MILRRAIVVAAGAAMLWLDRRFNVWEDEGYTLETTSHGVLAAARGAMRYEQYPPLYFALLAAWRRVHRSPFWARAFSTLAAALTIHDGSRVIAETVPEAEPAVVALALATHPFLVWSGTEARAYALVTWESALLLRAFRDAYLAERPCTAARLRFIALAITGIATQYYVGFLIAGCGLALALRRPKRTLAFAIDALAIAAGLVPLGSALRKQLPNYGENFNSAPTPSWLARHLGGSIASFVVPSNNMGDAWRPLALGALVTLAAPFVTDRRTREAAAVPLTIATSAALFFALALCVARVKPVLPKHAAALFVPAVLCAAAMLRTRRRIRLGAALVAAIGVRALVVAIRTPVKYGDWARAADHVQRHERVGEPVLIFQPEASLAFRHHYSGPNPLVAIPIEIPFDRYDLSRFVLHGPEDITASLARANVSERFWLVTTATANPLENDLHPEVLEQFIADRCTVLSDDGFVGSRVRLLSRIS